MSISATSPRLADGFRVRESTDLPMSQRSRGAADYLRVASTAAIVWFHADSSPGRRWCGPGLIVFVLLSFMHSGEPVPLLRFLRRRSERVLVPWAFWWAFYASVAIYRGADWPPASAWSVIAWPAGHLWYLPFLLVNSLALQACLPLLGSLSKGAKEGVALAAGLGLLLAFPRIPFADLPPGAGIWMTCLPAACVGAALGSCLRRVDPGRPARVLGVVAGVALASAYLVREGMYFEGVVAILGVLLAGSCALPIRRRRVVTKLALLTPGIYLIHPFAFMVLHRFSPAPPPWALTLTGILGGGLATWALKRNDLMKQVV